MKLELHILQNFAPSNLNRDDSGSPKDCELGGVRRARISSQCWKRAIRQAFAEHDLIPEGERAARTKRIVERVAAQLEAGARKGTAGDILRRAVTKALSLVELKTDDSNDKTEYLVFLPTRALAALAEVVDQHFDVLSAEAAPAPAEEAPARGRRRRAQRRTDEVPSEVRDAVVKILEDGARTPELALFGRMIANAPAWNVEAACQVAHALSTHRAAMEFDFYTAIDDLKKDDTAGSDMMGTVIFNSSCFYRYLVVDTAALEKNLGGEPEEARAQARRTLEAFLRAAVLAIPSGKQNSMAAHNPPSMLLAGLGDGVPRSLANAFVKPVYPSRGGDLVERSVEQLVQYAGALETVYGAGRDLHYCAVDPDGRIAKHVEKHLGRAKPSGTLDALVGAVLDQAFPGAPS